MKYIPSYFLAVIVFTVFPLLSNGQSRGVGAGSLIIDDGSGHSITIETPQPGDPGYALWVSEGGISTWKLPIPPFAGANAGFVLPGDTAGQLLTWIPAPGGGPQGYWQPMSLAGLNIGTGGGGGGGNVSGTGADSEFAVWTNNTVIGTSSLSENGGTLTFAGSDINTGTDYQIGGTTILTTPGIGNTLLGANAGFESGLGSHCTALGCGSAFGEEGGKNRTAVGAKAYVTQDNSLVLGSISGQNGATKSTDVGIGTTAPGATLDVETNCMDAMHIVNTSEGNNDILGDSWSVNNSGQLTAGGSDGPMYNAAVTLDNGHLASIEDYNISGSVAGGDSDENPDFPNMTFNYLNCGSSDVAGMIDFTIYHSAGGQYAEVDFAQPYSGNEIVTITPANAAAAMSLSSFYVTIDPNGNFFDINIDSQTPGNQEYQFYYHVIDIQCVQNSKNKQQNHNSN